MRLLHSLRFLCCLLLLVPAACTPPREAPDRLVIWHQKTGAERTFFEEIIREYGRRNPGDKVTALYREGEELRNSFIIAAVAGQGPDLVFGPSDNVAIFARTRVIRPWDEVLDAGFLDRFTGDGIVHWEGNPWLVADQIGNQLMLVYNRRMVERPPATLGEVVPVCPAAGAAAMCSRGTTPSRISSSRSSRGSGGGSWTGRVVRRSTRRKCAQPCSSSWTFGTSMA
jgi:maltose-binding protein MalE